MGLAATLMGFLRMCLAFIGTIFLLCGISLQFFSAGNLYGVRLCSKPEVRTKEQFNSLPAGEKLALLTNIVGTFIGVQTPNGYDAANPEFWCKNCPNDWRKNCPFDPSDTDSSQAGMQVDNVCQCPGGKVSSPGEAFWSTISDNALSSKYIVCQDKAEVYGDYIKAIFPRWSAEEVSHAQRRFETKCLQGKGGMGYILSVGPVLALFAGIFSIASLFKSVANTPVPVIGFNMGMVAIALTLVAFWAITFSGASGLISRYALCSGYSFPVVQNASFRSSDNKLRAAPVLYNEAPCFDINSEGQTRNNPFIEQLAAFNGAYISGGVLVVLALVCMLAISSKVSDVVMEAKLAGDNPPADKTAD